MLQLCAAGRAVCVILAARFAAVRARRYRAHFRQLVAQRSQLFLLGIDLRHLFVHFLVGDLCAAVQIVHQLADSLVQCFALGVQIENLQVDAGRQCKVVRLFAGYACRMTGDLARFYPPCPLPYPEKPAFSYP